MGQVKKIIIEGVKVVKKVLEYLKPELQEYAKILSPEGIPEFLIEYIETPEMQRIGKIGVSCGTQFTKIYNHKFIVSNLEHSILVALIIWNFTKDKKQTLSGLFHDIATPAFKHCIDFMNGDYKKQESTEEMTMQILRNSKQIMKLLERDGIQVEEVNDYHIYPIADNDTPKLSADRLEYTLSSGLFFNSKDIFNLYSIERIYKNIVILKNEEGIEELGFKDEKIATEFVSASSKLWPMWYNKDNRFTMQYIADTVKNIVKNNELSTHELYQLSEEEVIDKIENSKDNQLAENFKKFRNATKVNESEEPVKDKYCISVPAKRRYIVPLVETSNANRRINEISEQAKKAIEDYFAFEPKKYAYLDL